MSELEKKDINEMDAAEMLEQHQGLERDDRPGQTDEHWAADLIREFDENAKRWHRRKGWEAFGLFILSGLTVAACCAALTFGYRELILVGIGAANLMMAGAWWQKAKEGWQV